MKKRGRSGKASKLRKVQAKRRGKARSAARQSVRKGRRALKSRRPEPAARRENPRVAGSSGFLQRGLEEELAARRGSELHPLDVLRRQRNAALEAADDDDEEAEIRRQYRNAVAAWTRRSERERRPVKGPIRTRKPRRDSGFNSPFRKYVQAFPPKGRHQAVAIVRVVYKSHKERPFVVSIKLGFMARRQVKELGHAGVEDLVFQSDARIIEVQAVLGVVALKIREERRGVRVFRKAKRKK